MKFNAHLNIGTTKVGCLVLFKYCPFISEVLGNLKRCIYQANILGVCRSSIIGRFYFKESSLKRISGQGGQHKCIFSHTRWIPIDDIQGFLNGSLVLL